MRLDIGFEHLRPLVGFDGNEACGFLIADGEAIIDVWPTPSLRPSSTFYSIGRNAWIAAHRRAAANGVRVVGSIHTHPDGPRGPSELDLAIARRLRHGELRAVWHPRSGTLTLYSRQGIIATTVIPRPWWLRLIAPLFFA